jgi:hypothetical protein
MLISRQDNEALYYLIFKDEEPADKTAGGEQDNERDDSQ